MKKFIAGLVTVCFFVAAIPRPARADHAADPVTLGIAFGAVAFIVGVASFFGWKKHAKTEDTNQLIAKGMITSGTPTAFNGVPATVTFQTDDMEKPVVHTYQPIVQPIARGNNYGEYDDREPRLEEGESALCRAGKEAALGGVVMLCSSNNSRDDYCRCYRAARR